jgi:hypothetical protein
VRKLPKDLLIAIQSRCARAAIGPSSMRGAGSSGVVAAGRPHLCELQLTQFATADARRFRRALDRATLGLMESFPRQARHWGLARKGLNLFLRDCLYTVYLRDAYGLGIAEAFFEIPLDSFTGRELSVQSDGVLPRWKTVRGLDPALSDRFQQVGAQLARERGITRVHLDAFWWGQRE